MAPPEKPLRVLFVCSGNTCRSPMAEVLAGREASVRGLSWLEFRSAGTHATEGSAASGGARRAVQFHDLSLEGHSSTHLSPSLLEWADLVLTMGPGHLLQVRMFGAGGKSALLGAFAHGHDLGEELDEGEDFSVPDPFGGDDEHYQATFRTLEGYVKAAVRRIAEGMEG